MHIAAVTEVHSRLLPSLETLHVSSSATFSFRYILQGGRLLDDTQLQHVLCIASREGCMLGAISTDVTTA